MATPLNYCMATRTRTSGSLISAPHIDALGEGIRKRKVIKEYAGYRFRAEIDWIELKIRTKKPTNFHTVRKRLDAPFVETHNEGSGGAATEFFVKFYNPANWRFIDLSLQKLTHDHPLAGPIEVTGIEVALDAYSKSCDHHALAQMTAKFYRGLTYLVSENQRIVFGGKGSAERIPLTKVLLKKIEQGGNIYIGNSKPEGDLGDPNSWMLQHIYLKEVDRKKSLPIEEHRARIEITLKGVALPYKLLDEWKSHQFTAQSQFFKFRAPKEGLSLLQQSNFDAVCQYGAKRAKSADFKRRIYSGLTRADSALNARAYDALKNLSKRMRG